MKPLPMRLFNKRITVGIELIKGNFLKSLALSVAFVLLAGNVYGQAANRHVIVVTIDGFRPDFYLDDTWNTPNLKAIKQGGVHAYGVNSVFPSITYPSHTTIVTGVQPARHGIFYNALFAKDEAAKGQIYWKFDQITSPTLWEVAHQAGLKSASVNWPVSVGAPGVFNISDVGSQGQRVMEDSAYPAGISAVLKEQVLGHASEIKVGIDKNVAAIAAWVIKKEKPNFMTIHLLGMDHEQHLHGRNGPEVAHAIALTDSAVGTLRRAIADAGMKENTILIVTGDHGFYDVTTSVGPNVWLKQWGFLSDEGNWKAKFHTTGGGAFMFLKDKNDEATLNAITARLQSLPESVRKYYTLIQPKDLEQIGADPNVALALSGTSGAAFNARHNGEAIEVGKGGTHGYFPNTKNIQTGFLAEGSSLKSGTVVQEMNLRDISAIVLKYLELDMPSAEGELPVGIFR